MIVGEQPLVEAGIRAARAGALPVVVGMHPVKSIFGIAAG